MIQGNIPVWNKYILSIEEAAEYFHIGINKMRRLVSENKNAAWILWNSNRALIKRRIFEDYIDKVNSL